MDMDENERYAWVQLALTSYIGAESFLRLYQYYGSAQAALRAPASEVRRLAVHGNQAATAWADKDQARVAADEALKWELQSACRLLLLCDDDYPMMLNEGLTAPPLLFLRGNSELLQRPAVAIVGSRHATPQAMRIACDFGRDLSGRGITVVSGMAAGIDTAAHTGALQEQGGTIAVWGTGIDRVYPQSNKALAHKIAESGLIISEFPLGTRPLAGNFPRRNRLIAAQSHAVLVVEAAVGSGSLITASQAAEMGREVMAVPGSIDNPHSKGCHHLIKNGAKLVECSDDILSECPALVPLSGSLKTKKADNKQPEKASAAKRRPQSAIHIPATAAKQPENPEADIPEQTPPVAVSSDDEHPLLRGMGYGAVHPDMLAESLSLPAADVYACLVEWELDGIVAAMPGGRYQRIR